MYGDMVPAGIEVRRLLEQIRVLTNNPAIQRASDQIEVLCSAYMEPDQSTMGRKLGLTGNLAIIFDLLQKRLGHMVSKEALHAACTRNEDTSGSLDVLDVQVCRLRKLLIGSKYEGAVETVRGLGYQLKQTNKAGKPFIPYSERKECPRGHAYDAANTYINAKSKQRVCRKCRVQLYRERYRGKPNRGHHG
jgi:DNA-binding winged helix-turn-helix (wHTH) protein